MSKSWWASVGLSLVVLCVGFARTLTGTVVGVTDGDTVVVRAGEETLTVRLHGIDAPEAKQPFGARAKQELSELVFKKAVRVEIMSRDRYGRQVGRVFVGKTDVNLELVRRGLAWWYREYARGDRELAEAEAEARADRRGLWSDPEPMPPWQTRNRNK